MPLPKDLTLALRQLHKAPGYSIITILTLALGIGVNVAVFGLLYSVTLRSLPVPEPSQLVRGLPGNFVSGDQYDALIEELAPERSPVFESLSIAASGSLTLTGEGTPALLGTTVVDPAHFDVFGIEPALGRRLEPDDAKPGAEPVALLTWGLWQSRFAGEPVLGRRLAMSGEGASQRTIVGILPQDHDLFPWQTDVLVPVRRDLGSHDWQDMVRFWLIGRLRPDVSEATASSALALAVSRLSARPEPLFPSDMSKDARVESYLSSWVGATGRSLTLLFLAVLAVLLVASVNVSHLASARLLGRERELAIRTALGAERATLLRQLVVEATVLSVLGGLIGTFFAVVGIEVLSSTLPDVLERSREILIGPAVFAFAIFLSLLTGVVFGLAPAIGRTRHLEEALHEAGRSGGPSRSRARRSALLISAQVALCTVLAVASGMLVKSLWRLSQVDPGFQPERVYSLLLRPPEARYGEEPARQQFYRNVEERIAALPLVESVGSTSMLPLNRGIMGVGISPDGDPVPSNERPMMIRYRAVTPGYVETLGLRLLAGRDLEGRDRTGSEAVGLINKTLAERLWPGQGAVGKELSWDDGSPWLTVVGVLDDFHQTRLSTAIEPEVYVPYLQEAWIPSLYLVVRARGEMDLQQALRQTIWSIDPDVPLSKEASMIQVVSESMAQPRFYASLFTGFALLALVLGAIGVYGVMSHNVRRQSHELGVRAALGASDRDLLRSSLVRGMTPVVVGLGVGVVAALATSRLLGSFLFEVEPGDPGVLLATVSLLGMVALLANLGPALRASRIDPLRVLSENH